MGKKGSGFTLKDLEKVLKKHYNTGDMVFDFGVGTKLGTKGTSGSTCMVQIGKKNVAGVNAKDGINPSKPQCTDIAAAVHDMVKEQYETYKKAQQKKGKEPLDLPKSVGMDDIYGA